MKAYVLKAAGKIDNLQLSDLPVPIPENHEVLIQVRAISINPVDVKTRAGHALYEMLAPVEPLILGWDVSGVVTATGKAATKFKVGDEVFGMLNFPGHGAAYAEYVAAQEGHLAIKPAGISHEAAAAATLAALTAWQGLTIHTQLKKGDRILIHAAAGGVGNYAVQIARHLGAEVTGTSSSVNKQFILDLGADVHLDYQKHRFEEVSGDFDLILDTIGGEHFIRSLDAVKKTGTVINLIPEPEGQRIAGVQKKSTLQIAKERGINGVYFPVTSSGKDMEAIAGLLEKGILKSHVTKTYRFDQLHEAHAHVETGRTTGKVVVVL